MSRNIIELLHSSVETSTDDSVQFKNLLQYCLEQGSFYCQDNVEPVIKIINICLNSSFDKGKGLILLQHFLSQISVEAFSSNAVSWMVNSNKIVSQKEGINSVLALQVLSKLIKLSVKFPEVNKEAAKQIVPKFLLDNVRRRSIPQVSVELLECIGSCMREYPGPSGEFRMDIVKLLLSTVEAQREVVGAASRCVPLVAGVGGGGKQGVSHKTAWQRQQLALVRLLHSLLNRLYEHVDCQVEEDTGPLEDVHFDVDTINDKDILSKSQRLATQITSVALFLQAMLLEEFPVAKAVAPDTILDVVAHAQKPTLASLGSSREALAVTAVLPTVQVAALRLLESLVLCLGRNLIPQSGLVCYLCSQVVHWTHHQHPDWPYAMDKPFSQTRHAAYCCLHSWLTVAGAASKMETVMDKLLPPMLADIHAEKPSVRLRVGSKTGKGKRKQQVLISQEDRSEKLGDLAANRRLCERALLTLVLLLRHTVAKLKHDTISSITDTVLKLVAELPVPYSDTNCLTALYQLLLTLCLEPHPRVMPPLAPALAVFTTATHHPAPTVRVISAAALSSLDKIIHPTAATLYFPVAQDKENSGKGSDEEENYEENVVPVVKRMRVESPNYNQTSDFSTSENEGKLSVKPLNENDIEVINCDDSSHSDEVVELSQLKGIKTKPELKKGSPTQNVNYAVIVESDEEIDVEIIEDNENVDRDSQKPEKETSSLNSKTVTEDEISPDEKSRKKEDILQTIEEGLQSSTLFTREVEHKIEPENDLVSNADKTSEDDADVSLMLMDFTDEVNESTEN